LARTLRRLFSKRMRVSCLLLTLVGAAFSHEIYPGKCPDFNPMKEFSWEKFSAGQWFVTQKFSTKSTCLTYEFKTDNIGFKTIEQIRQLPYSKDVGVDHEYKYTGKLYAPSEAQPAKMVVRFPLNVAGEATFVVTDTDYETYGMACTCQDVDLFLTWAHRISCSILQRAKEEDPEITKKLKDTVEEKYAHDFDKINQADCDYGREKTWKIDVDKILGSVTGADKDSIPAIDEQELKDITEEFAGEFETSQLNKEQLKEIAENNNIL